jgi:hypothetical protein
MIDETGESFIRHTLPFLRETRVLGGSSEDLDAGKPASRQSVPP